MSRHKPKRQAAPPPPPKAGLDRLGLATLAGVVVLLLISFSNLRRLDRVQERLDGKLGDLKDQIARVSGKLGTVTARVQAQAQAAPAAQPARRGPDPERVYRIKTAGAPTRGPAGAPITIAEFSDFQ